MENITLLIHRYFVMNQISKINHLNIFTFFFHMFKVKTSVKSLLHLTECPPVLHQLIIREDPRVAAAVSSLPPLQLCPVASCLHSREVLQEVSILTQF